MENISDDQWIVGAYGGDDVLKQFTVNRPSGGLSAREWVLDTAGLVRIWDERSDAEAYAAKLNKNR